MFLKYFFNATFLPTVFFFCQAEDGIRDGTVTGVQTCALPILAGLAERGVLKSCDGVLSGYMGSAQIGAAILDAVASVKAANPAAHYCCDPVIGDAGRGVYVRPGIVELLTEHAVPAADVVTPNQFELEQLTGQTSAT